MHNVLGPFPSTGEKRAESEREQLNGHLFISLEKRQMARDKNKWKNPNIMN
jgi:hypothetical protein